MDYLKRAETIIIGTIIVVLAIAYGLLNDKASAPTNTNTQEQASNQQQTAETGDDSQQMVATSQVQYQGEDGKNAMELLKAKYRVETQSFGGVGEFVKSINGIEPGATHFWSLYVNGSQSQVGATEYMTKSTDSIEWKLEEIK